MRPSARVVHDRERVVTGEVDYDRWYPAVPAVMDAEQLAELLNSSDQIISAWVRDGIVPRPPPPGRPQALVLSPDRKSVV